MNVNDKTVQRIDDLIDRVEQTFDRPRLEYIRSQLTPSGIANRSEYCEDVSHLREVADLILKPIERQASHD